MNADAALLPQDTTATPGAAAAGAYVSNMDPYVERILRASVYDVAIETPLDRAPRLSSRLGVPVSLKREDLQPVFSFKIRGAQNRIAQLSEEQAARGVICASAGNHAQGVALAARRRGIRALIVMPSSTPAIKVNAVRDFGGEVRLHGEDFDSAYAHARQLAAENGATFIHPFDDPDVIAGQGTIAVELLRQRRGERIDAVFVPVGGGGLIAGIAAYIKSLYPSIRVIGVEPYDAAAMHASLAAGRRVRLDRVGLFADGVAVREVGVECLRLAHRHVDDVIRVDTDEICAAIQDIFEDTRAIVEPSGALAVAGLKRYASAGRGQGGELIAINSGANMNFDRLRHVAERADLGAQREALFAVRIPERPGSFLRFCEIIGARNVTEFNYRYADDQEAQIFVGLALNRGADERRAVRAAIAQAGFFVQDLSDNELAKLHVRYMVGGKANSIRDERLFRFEFPERPGALLRFLQAVGASWNISLFHYRNHGSDYGRVLAGIQVPAESNDEFAAHLDALGYARVEETGNAAYRAFL